MRNDSQNICTEDKVKYFMFSILSKKSCRLRKSLVEAESPQMKI